MTKPKHYDHTNTDEAMFAALVELNKLILALPGCEDTARAEAEKVSVLLKAGGISTADLTDYLHQAAIDFRANKGKYL